MKKIIIAMSNNHLMKEIDNYKEINYKNVQYREAILEILEKEKNINLIILDEKIPGEINIEKLIEKIKLINEKINIIFFLEKENNKKINILKKLGVNNIYINNKNNIENVINNLINKKTNNNLENKLNKKINNNFRNELNKKIDNNLKNKLNKKINNNFKNKLNKKIENKMNIKNNKVITIEGKSKSGKTTIAMLLINYLIIKNKKILLINLNKKTEKKYYKIFKSNKKEKKNKLENKKQIDNELKKSEIKVNKNLTFINNFQNIIEKNINDKIREFIKNYYKYYDYILIDIGDKGNKLLKNQLFKNSDKNLIVINSDIINYKELKNIRKNKKSYIIYNKYKMLSISDLILKNIVGKNFYSKIPFNNNYKYLPKEFLKNKNKFINYKIEKQLKRILINNSYKNILDSFIIKFYKLILKANA